MLLGASAWLLLGLIVTGTLTDLATLARAPLTVMAQAFISAVTFVLYFRLQGAAGPVYLSQIGYVMTATGLLSGMMLFGESYEPAIWLAAILIMVGVVLTTRARY